MCHFLTRCLFVVLDMWCYCVFDVWCCMYVVVELMCIMSRCVRNGVVVLLGGACVCVVVLAVLCACVCLMLYALCVCSVFVLSMICV